MDSIISRLAKAALPHVAFDGWSEETFLAACADSDIAPELARVHAPRGAVDLAAAAHELGDQALRERLAAMDLTALRFRDRVTEAILLRLDAAGDREVVRKASSLFALPHLALEGGKLIWGTADVIWTALGDTSQDLNWYSKRMTLSAVYGATVLYWLGDESEDLVDTRAFVERRIADVMQIESTKTKLRANPLTSPMMKVHSHVAGLVKAPRGVQPSQKTSQGGTE